MAFYAASVSSASPGTTNDVLTITAAASRHAWVHEVSVSGEGTASAAGELDVTRATTVGATPTAQTPIKLDPDSAAPGATIATAWTTQPVVEAVKILRLGVNANGGVYRWVAKPGMEITLRGTGVEGQLSLRFGTAAATTYGTFLLFEDA